MISRHPFTLLSPESFTTLQANGVSSSFAYLFHRKKKASHYHTLAYTLLSIILTKILIVSLPLFTLSYALTNQILLCFLMAYAIYSFLSQVKRKRFSMHLLFHHMLLIFPILTCLFHLNWLYLYACFFLVIEYRNFTEKGYAWWANLSLACLCPTVMGLTYNMARILLPPFSFAIHQKSLLQLTLIFNSLLYFLHQFQCHKHGKVNVKYTTILLALFTIQILNLFHCFIPLSSYVSIKIPLFFSLVSITTCIVSHIIYQQHLPQITFNQCMSTALKKTDKNGMTQLMRAVHANNSQQFNQIIKLPFCDTSVIKKTTKDGWTALHYAIAGDHQNIINAIKKTGYFTPYKHEENVQLQTLLYAIKNNSVENVQAILKRPFGTFNPLMKKDQHGKTALIWAMNNPDTTIIKAIIQSPHLNKTVLMQQSKCGVTALMWAIHRGNTEIVNAILQSKHCDKELIMQQSKHGTTALMWAIHRGNTEIVKTILQSKHFNKEALRQQCKNGNNALKYTAIILHSGISVATSQPTDQNNSRLRSYHALLRLILASPHCHDEVLKQGMFDNHDFNHESGLIHYFNALSPTSTSNQVEQALKYAKRTQDHHLQRLCEAKLYPTKEALEGWRKVQPCHKTLALELAPYPAFSSHLDELLETTDTKLTPEEKTAIFDRAIQFSNDSAVMIILRKKRWLTHHIKSLLAMARRDVRLFSHLISKRLLCFNMRLPLHSIVPFLSYKDLMKISCTAKRFRPFLHVPTIVAAHDTHQNMPPSDHTFS